MCCKVDADQTRADRANLAIMEHLNNQDLHLATQDQKFEDLYSKFERFETLLERIDKTLLKSSNPAPPMGITMPEAAERRSLGRQQQPLESPIVKSMSDQKLPPQALAQIPMAREAKVEASPSGSHATASTEQNGCDSSMSVLTPKERVEHTTAAHKLLSWPSIKKLVNQQLTLREIAMHEDYVMDKEKARGLLRLYGVGEGTDVGDGGEPGKSPTSPLPGQNSTEHSSPNSMRGEDHSDVSSPRSVATPPEGIWGYGFIPPVTTPSTPYRRDDPNHDFSLNIHPTTLRRLLDSYLENIHLLHPFLDKVRLTRMVERFSLRYNPTEQKLTRSLFSAPGSSAGVEMLRGTSTGGKRKLSDSYNQNFSADSTYSPASNKREILFERSISTAIVLLVLALGRICEWKDRLPGVPRENKAERRRTPLDFHYYQAANRSTQSPPTNSLHTSPPSNSWMLIGGASAPSPASMYRNSLPSPRSNTDEPPLPRNVDIIPGLSYYAPATDILGNLHGSNDLAHVQAYLLAGLFTGQLARSFESFNWISSACMACRFLVRE